MVDIPLESLCNPRRTPLKIRHQLLLSILLGLLVGHLEILDDLRVLDERDKADQLSVELATMIRKDGYTH